MAKKKKTLLNSFEEAEKYAMTVPWKTSPCEAQGDKCWCRIIEPKKPVWYKNGEIEEEYYVNGSGTLHKEIAEYIVKLHNFSLEYL